MTSARRAERGQALRSEDRGDFRQRTMLHAAAEGSMEAAQAAGSAGVCPSRRRPRARAAALVAAGLVLLSATPAAANVVWYNCDTSAPIQMTSLWVAPQPLDFGLVANFAGAATVASTLVAPIKAVVSVKAKTGPILTPLPCVTIHADGKPIRIGSCTYDDICDPAILGGEPFCSQRLEPVFSADCLCPVAPGTYTVPLQNVSMPGTSLPSWLTSGTYVITITLYDGSSVSEAGCLSMTGTID